MTPVTNQPPDPSNEIRFDIGGKTVLRLTVDGMTYNDQLIQDAGEAHRAMVTVLTDVMAIALRKAHLIPVEAVREFAKWSEGIFQEYESLKPDEYDAPEVQAETAASIKEDRQYLLSFLAEIGMRPEGVEDGDESWIYTAEYLHEIITYGMVEGGYMPDPEVLITPPGPSREAMLESVRKSLRCQTDAPATGMPPWVIQALREMLEDEVLLLTLYCEVCAVGWVQGNRVFEGCTLRSWAPPPDSPDALQRIREVRDRCIPPTKPVEPPAEPDDGPPPAEFSVGSYVTYKPGRGVLRCVSGTYERAVVASMEPFVLVSKGGDMLWRATVKAEDFVWEGEAERFVLLAVLDRFKRELYPTKPEEVTQ